MLVRLRLHEFACAPRNLIKANRYRLPQVHRRLRLARIDHRQRMAPRKIVGGEAMLLRAETAKPPVPPLPNPPALRESALPPPVDRASPAPASACRANQCQSPACNARPPRQASQTPARRAAGRARPPPISLPSSSPQTEPRYSAGESQNSPSPAPPPQYSVGCAAKPAPLQGDRIRQQ